ncbi:MAG: bifunctional class I SAM-dependent methyltransferase/glycosyltransferase family 2 protein [bacterium]|nr:bifunctional class I SAM-dependent methyltransferase/glycosyltransferase family 2 protein [bacterium]
MELMAERERVEELDRIAAERDTWKRRARGYHAAIERIYRFFVPRGRRVLEVGCATGDLLVALEPVRGVGVDVSSVAIARAREKYGGIAGLSFVQGDAHTFRLEEKFEYVVMSDTIGYLEDVQVALENLHHVMTPRSRLVINSYNFLWEPLLRLATWLGLKQPQPAESWLSVADIENLLRLADFEVVHKENFLLLPMQIPVVSAIMNGFLVKLPGLRHLGLAQFIIARPCYRPGREALGKYSVSVIIPARNEAGNIEAAVQRTPEMGAWTELIFVEGHSRDSTWEEIQRVQEAYPHRRIKIMQQDGKGKKDAVYKGFAHASGDVLMILDADLTMPPENLPKFYRALVENHGEYINGCRLVYPMEKQAMRFLNLLGNKFFSLAFSYLLGQRYKDTLCGTKVLWRADWERILADHGYFGEFDPFGDFDIIFGAAKLGLKTVEIPIRYRERTYGTTQISRFRHGWLLIKMTWVGFVKFKWQVR